LLYRKLPILVYHKLKNFSMKGNKITLPLGEKPEYNISKCKLQRTKVKSIFLYIFPPRANPSPEANPPLVKPLVEPPADNIQFVIRHS